MPDRRAQVLPEGQVTLLFSDIEGSTRLLHELGDSYGDLLAAYSALLREVWVEHGGVEVGTEGDSFFVAFALAEQAVTAAGEAQRVLAAAVDQLYGVRVRIGVHTGAPRLRDGTYWGADVHYAARLSAAANGGQVLLSASTRALCPDAGVEDLGEHALKDFPAARRIFHLTVDGQPAKTFPAIRSVKAGQTNLPDQISSFIGRDHELAALHQLVADNRIVTLVGAGGVGKTRLAVRLGSELLDGSGDGVWFIDLAPLTDSALVVSTIAAGVGVPARQGEEMLVTLGRALSDRQLLLILDNCEHLLDTTARLTVQLLGQCPGLSVLATSREPLHVAGEQVYRVPSLSAPDEATDPDHVELEHVARSEAVQLFIERARQQRSEFSLTAANAASVASVCRRLDGIPLAIELAAVRLGALSVDQLDARLDQRFRLLKTKDHGLLPRQQTLHSLIDWSYQLLSEDEQTVLTRLSVFAPTGFDLSAAEAVCAGQEIDALDVFDHVDTLVDKSLLHVSDVDGQLRYRLLETVREYARDRLAASSDQSAARAAHRDHYRELASTFGSQLFGPTAEEHLGQLEAEHDNLRLTLDRCLAETDPLPGLELAASLSKFWQRHSHEIEGLRILEEHLNRPGAERPTTGRGYALAAHANLIAIARGAVRASLTESEEVLQIADLVGDKRLKGQGLRRRAWALIGLGEWEQSLSVCDEGILLARAHDDAELLCGLMSFRGIAQAELGGDPRPALEMALSIARQHGDRSYEATMLGNLSTVEQSAENMSAARTLNEQAKQIYADLSDLAGVDWIDQKTAWLSYIQGDRVGVAQRFRHVLMSGNRSADAATVASCVLGLAMMCQDPEVAAQLQGWVEHTDASGFHADFLTDRSRANLQNRLESTLGAERCASAHKAGAALSRSEATALALEATAE
jgi:predicted ATPase/class 3 adenylate cyclase